MKRITVFELVLTSVILSLALTAKFFDNFIPHVHPIAVTVLILGVAILRFRMSLILIGVFLLMKYLLFGVKEITPFMIAMHQIQVIALSFVAIINIIKVKKKNNKLISLAIIIVIAMLLYLTFMVIGDSDYTSHTVPFMTRVKLALIYPGDWLNVLITTILAIFIVVPSYMTFKKVIESSLQKRLW